MAIHWGDLNTAAAGDHVVRIDPSGAEQIAGTLYRSQANIASQKGPTTTEHTLREFTPGNDEDSSTFRPARGSILGIWMKPVSTSAFA